MREWILTGVVATAMACGGGNTSPDVVVARHDGGTDTGMSVTDTGTQHDTGGGPTDTGGACTTGQTMCGTACTTLGTDTANCGACSHACATGEACNGGTCGAPMTCPTGQASCGGACVNTAVDTANCGACAHACATGQVCAAGACGAAISCPGAQMDCGGTCTDVTTDANNCGSCGHPCGTGTSCVASACVTATCATGQTRCSGVCVDTTNDTANCGACGTACTASQSCVAGTCTASCAAPSMVCTSGTSMTCTNVTTDGANCGTCGHACASGTSCVAGACGCPTGQTSCSGACVATATDNANCGTCGHACGASETCAGGTCTCPSGQTDCAGTCANLQTDTSHCGACTTACTAPSSCNMGVCNTLCGTGTTSCGGSCVNVGVDNHNCGACGVVCGTGTTCTTGTCVPNNDARAHAATITLGAAEVVTHGTTAHSTHDGSAPCGCTSGGDVWYTFTLTAAGVVYFDTAGSGIDTSLYFTASTGVPIAAQTDSGYANAGNCNDDASCAVGGGFTSVYESQTAAYLSAGTYYVVVSGCADGPFTLNAQYVQQSVGTYFYSSRITGNNSASTFVENTSVTSSPCGGAGTGEDVRWFTTCGGQQEFFSVCPSDTGATWERRNAATYFDSVMYIRSAQTNAQVSCDDDGGSMGGTNCVGTVSGAGGTASQDAVAWGSRLNNIVTPRGLNTEFVDSNTGAAMASGPSMHYTLVYRLH